MQADRSPRVSRPLAALAQAGLAALVAGSLLTFSTIAFRTAFDEPIRDGGIVVSTPRTAAPAPVVLGSPPPPEPEEAPAPVRAVAEVPTEPETVVLGIREERKPRGKASRKRSPAESRRTASHGSAHPDDAHEKTRGKGHEKARGKGHLKDRDERDRDERDRDERGQHPKDGEQSNPGRRKGPDRKKR